MLSLVQNKWKSITDKVSDSVMLTLSLTLVNGVNYMLTLILGRWLGPAYFGEISFLTTGLLILSFFGLGLQLTTARFLAKKPMLVRTQDHILEQMRNIAGYSGLILAAVMMVSASFLASIFHFQNSTSFYLFALGIPLYFLMSVERGQIQGAQAFRKLSLSYVFETMTRFALTIAGVYTLVLMDKSLFSEVVVAALLISFLAAARIRWRPKMKFRNLNFTMKPMYVALVVFSAYELCQVIINYADLISAKRFFTLEMAGQYAALSTIGRIVYFASWAAVPIIVSRVAQKSEDRGARLAILKQALLFVISIGSGITLLSWIGADIIVQISFGSAYEAISNYLPVYSAITVLFTAINVIIYYYITLQKYTPVIMATICGLAQIFAYTVFNDGFESLIRVQAITLAALLIGLIYYHTKNK